jgi:methylenetetrahydrofolate--tRNA-(uracil-5-)-methyltransferase
LSQKITIVGAGLAGSEAAWQVVKQGLAVDLWEMRPEKLTPAHHTGLFSELVCSNSLRGASLENAVGLLKEEMRRLDSLIIQSADLTKVPAGGALAVDRHQFAGTVTEILSNHPLIKVHRAEIKEIPQGPTIIASGPLTSGDLAKSIRDFIGRDYFYFYDAAAPIVTGDSINREIAFEASRYGKGEGAYLNCPFGEDQYHRFWEELVGAQVSKSHLPDERALFFEGCMPVEVLAKRGIDTIRYGPMKPVGLINPATGKRPYAVVQLRPEDREGRLYNLVGFQTHLKWSEQERVFHQIPGLENAEFVRFGVMHRNTYLNAPMVLKRTLQCKWREDLFFAGQMTGVEGYVESAGTGLLAGLNCAGLVAQKRLLELPAETAIGSLVSYICNADPRYFQPMNVNFGLFPPITGIPDRKGKKAKQAIRAHGIVERSLNILNNFVNCY